MGCMYWQGALPHAYYRRMTELSYFWGFYATWLFGLRLFIIQAWLTPYYVIFDHCGGSINCIKYLLYHWLIYFIKHFITCKYFLCAANGAS